jgi:uncharacterized protein (DUF885 family)
MTRLAYPGALLTVSLVLAACSSSGVPDISPPPITPEAAPLAPAPNAALAKIADDVWKRLLAHDVTLRAKFGLPLESLPDPSYAAARKDAAEDVAVLHRLETIDPATLNDEDRITYGMLDWDARLEIDGLSWFWHRFPVTPYATEIRPVNSAFATFTFKTADDTARYLHLIDAYPAFLDAIGDIVREEEQRNIRLPKDEIAIVKGMLGAYQHDGEASPFFVAGARLAAIPEGERSAFQGRLREGIATKVNPALQRLLDLFDDHYAALAPAAVGLSQYPGGLDAYRYAIRANTSLNLAPEEIHRIGLAEVARIDAEMQKVRDQLNFAGTKAEFHASLHNDPRFFARTPEEEGARLTILIHKIEPHIPQFFARQPKAPYDVQRLDPRLEGSMTFGYYQPPTVNDAVGHYYYNGSRLNERNLLFAAGLMCHELIPGHHFQIARQEENESLPALRRESFDNAFVEGWGEYAANLGFDMGVYDDPYDRYGRLLMDSMIASRLVVDTGMNAFGWSRERASAFLRDHTILSDSEIATETLRYAVDIPGQALAYKIGSNEMLALRRRAQDRLGPKFDIRQFHEWLIGSGSMPLGVLERHIDDEVKKAME